jgi:hypothetical protein
MPVVRVDGLRQQFINLPSVYHTPNNQAEKGTEREPVCEAKDSARQSPIRFAPLPMAAGRSRPHPGRVHSKDLGENSVYLMKLPIKSIAPAQACG